MIQHRPDLLHPRVVVRRSPNGIVPSHPAIAGTVQRLLVDLEPHPPADHRALQRRSASLAEAPEAVPGEEHVRQHQRPLEAHHQLQVVAVLVLGHAQHRSGRRDRVGAGQPYDRILGELDHVGATTGGSSRGSCRCHC